MRRTGAFVRILVRIFAVTVQAKPAPSAAIPKVEFICLMAALMATNALAMDIMLPALQQIGLSLGVENENHRQFVIPAYIFGFGFAQLFFGPLSDRFGRRAPLLIGLVVYVVAAAGAAVAPTFESLLLLRLIQGMGAAATRVISISIVRDTFEGRRMAEVMSLVFMIFMAVPIAAPGLGQIIMMVASWHFTFVAMAVTAFGILIWTWVRLPETLARENRRPLTVTSIASGFRAVLTNRIALCYAFGSTFIFGATFGFIVSAQQIFTVAYGLGNLFPLVFALFGGVLAFSNFLNSRLVGKFGMRQLSHGALLMLLFVSLAWFVISLLGAMPLFLFLALFAIALLPFGALGSNFNALAMEPLGYVAGTASSVLGFMQTIGGGLIGTFIGQTFDGTVTPLGAGFCLVSLAALGIVLIAERGKLFQPHHTPI